jgi:hypothetical protein
MLPRKKAEEKATPKPKWIVRKLTPSDRYG